jgi:hypothetical protein
MRPTLTIAALIVASPALAGRCPPGQLYRVRLDECVSLNSPLARPYLYSANLGRKIDASPEESPPAAVDPPAEQPPPDKVDEAAWLMIPLLRAAEVRWATMMSPLRVQTPREPWPSLSVYGIGNEGQDLLPPAP